MYTDWYDSRFILRKLTEYNFIKDIFPDDFSGKKLVFYENDVIIDTINYDNDDFEFSPYRGVMAAEYDWDEGSRDDIINGISRVNLKITDEYSGTWESTDSNTITETRNGKFFYYDTLLDINNNGISDANDDSDEFEPNMQITTDFIAGKVANLHPPLQSFTGFIQLYPDTSTEYDLGKERHFRLLLYIK